MTIAEQMATFVRSHAIPAEAVGRRHVAVLEEWTCRNVETGKLESGRAIRVIPATVKAVRDFLGY